MAEDKPEIWVIAGTNGAGKSTVGKKALQEIRPDITYIDPDVLITQLGLDWAVTVIEQMIQEHVDAKKSFAIETTLSDEGRLQLAERLKQNGWSVGTVYVGVESPEVAEERVLHRIVEGGHPVEAGFATLRLPVTEKNAVKLLNLADTGVILDNTEKPRLVATVRDGTLKIAKGKEHLQTNILLGLKGQGLEVVSRSVDVTHGPTIAKDGPEEEHTR